MVTSFSAEQLVALVLACTKAQTGTVKFRMICQELNISSEALNQAHKIVSKIIADGMSALSSGSVN